MAQENPTWLRIEKPNSEEHETLVDRRLVLLEKATTTPFIVWKEWPDVAPAVAYDAEGNVVKYLQTPTGTTFEIELDQTFTSATAPTGWLYGNFAVTSGKTHVFVAEQGEQIDGNNSFTFLRNEDNSTILIEVGALANGSFNFYYEDGTHADSFTINGKRYGYSSDPSRYYVITLPEPDVLAGDKVKLVYEP